MIGRTPEDDAPNRSSSLDAFRTPAEPRSPTDPAGSGPDAARAAEQRPTSGSPSGSGAGATVPPEAPGLRDQVGATRDALKDLVGAHVELARSEFGEIADEVKRASILGAVAFTALLLAAIFLPFGLSLFLGEWLFGSIGWGVLHGTLLMLDVGLMAGLLIVARPRGMTADFVVAVVAGVVLALILGLNLTNQGWTLLGDQIAGNVSTDIRPLVVGAGVLAIVGAVLGLLAGFRGGVGGAIGGMIFGAILGALLGALTATALGPQVGIAVAVTAALIVWPALMGWRVSREGIDTAALKARFWPDVTIDTTKETIEWVRRRTPLGRGS